MRLTPNAEVTKIMIGFHVQIIASMTNHSLIVWDPWTGAQVRILEGHKKVVPVLEGHPFLFDLVVSASYDGQAILWDIDTGKQLTR